MSDNERPERSGIEAIDRLAELTPDEARRAALVDRVRAALPPREVASRSVRRRVLAALIAASIAIGLTALLWPVLEPRSARAELIAALVATTQASRDGDSISVETVGADYNMRVLLQREPLLMATTFGGPGEREVWLSDFGTGTESRWTEKDATLRVGAMAPAGISRRWESLRANYSFMSGRMDHVLDELRGFTPENLEIESAMEGALKRYDLRYYVAAKDSPDGKRQLTGRRTYWVDPSSGLVQRLTATMPESTATRRATVSDDTPTMSYSYRYDSPTVRDAFDLGVPRDTTILDRRPVGRATELLDRLDANARSAFQRQGLTVAISVPVEEQGLDGPAFGWVHLMLRTGEQWFSASLSVCDGPGVNGAVNQARPAATTKPTGWPAIDPLAVTALFGHPSTWESAGDSQRTRDDSTGKDSEPVRGNEASIHSIPGRAYPTRDSLSAYYWSRSIRIEKGDGLERLVVEDESIPGKPRGYLRSATLDANTGRVITLEQVSAHRRETWTYLEYATLPDGTEMPTRWRHEESITVKGRPPRKLTLETRVMHLNEPQLPPSWRVGAAR